MTTTIELIKEALRNAAENGYAAEVAGLSDTQLAIELHDRAGLLEDVPFDEILQAVKEFRRTLNN